MERNEGGTKKPGKIGKGYPMQQAELVENGWGNLQEKNRKCDSNTGWK